MTNKTTFAAATLAGLCLWPAATLAQQSGSDASAAASPTSAVNEVSFGLQSAGGVNTNQFGRYNGFTTKGLDLVGAFTFSNRTPPDSGKTFYYEFTGSNLDLQTGDHLADHFSDGRYRSSTANNIGPNSQINVRLGNQGHWDATAAYRAISYTGNIIDSLYTINGANSAAGVLNGGLPPYGGASNAPLTMGANTSFTTTTLSPYLRPFQVGTRRDIFEAGGDYLIGAWTITSSIHHEHKKGSVEESIYQNYGGVTFAEPTDHDTDRFDISAAYKTRKLQALVQYTFFNFQDNIDAITFPHVLSVASLTANSGPYAQAGLYSLPPSNQAHYVTAMVADSLTRTTRITFNGRVGVELQDDTIPANNADPNLSSSLGMPKYAWFQHLNAQNQGTSANSPDAVAFIYQGKVAVHSNLTKNLEAQASYAFDGRNIHLNQYLVWIGGSGPDANANTAAYVVPQNWFKQNAKLEASYRLRSASNTKLTIDYDFNDTHRTNAQVQHSTTNTESVQLSSSIGPSATGLVSYTRSDRNGTLIYGTAWGNLENGVPKLYDTPSGAYYQAPMTSDTVLFRANFAPVDKFSAGVFLKYVDERYHYPSIPPTAPPGSYTLTGYGTGIREHHNFSVGPDINYRPSDKINLHLYYTYEEIYYNNLGNGACAESNTGKCAGSAGYFRNTYKNGVNTAGFNGEWQATQKLKLTAEYNVSYGTTSFGEFNGVEVTNISAIYQNVVNYPNINSLMHDVNVAANYQVSSRIECGLIYQYGFFHNNNWDNLAAPVQATTNTGTTISTLTAGYNQRRYNVSLVRAVATVRF